MVDLSPTVHRKCIKQNRHPILQPLFHPSIPPNSPSKPARDEAPLRTPPHSRLRLTRWGSTFQNVPQRQPSNLHRKRLRRDLPDQRQRHRRLQRCVRSHRITQLHLHFGQHQLPRRTAPRRPHLHRPLALGGKPHVRQANLPGNDAGHLAHLRRHHVVVGVGAVSRREARERYWDLHD